MRKYVYDNATVYITEPTEAQLKNIREATERFVKRLAKEGLIGHDNKRRNNRRIGRLDTDARRGNSKAKKKN